MHISLLSSHSMVLAFAALLGLTSTHPTPQPVITHSTNDLTSLYFPTPSTTHPPPINPPTANLLLTSPKQQAVLRDHHQPARGTIKMHSTQNHHIPLNFTLSSQTCKPIASETICVINDLSMLMLRSYQDAYRDTTSAVASTDEPCAESSATQVLMTETVRHFQHGREYRATLHLSLERIEEEEDEEGGEEAVSLLSRDEFTALVGLLGRTAGALWKETMARRKDGRDGEEGLGFLGVEGLIEGVAVDAKWVFYEVVGGEARVCGGLDRE